MSNIILKIRQIFLKGLLTLLPIAVSIYIIYAGFSILENLLGSILRSLLPNHVYIPGFGFILTLILIFIFGLMLNNLISVSFWSQIESKLTEVPLIKAVYSPLRDLMNLFTKGHKDLQRVVLAEITPGFRVIGLVTRESFADIAKWPTDMDHKVTVYIPLSYALGGITLLVDKNKLTQIDIPVEKALSLAVTGWVTTEKEGKK